MALERLQKIIAAAGSDVEAQGRGDDSRRGESRWGAKRITLLGTKADPLKDRIEVDGKQLNPLGPKILYPPLQT